jgi:hypothetical protein
VRRSRGAAAPNGNAMAWKITLAAGLAAELVVWGLLEQLRRTVVEVDEGVDALWTAGQRLAQNTQVTHVLGAVGDQGAELVDELARHRAPTQGGAQ